MVIKHRLRIFLILIIIILIFQCYKITRPFSGHFASYQTVMAEMARNMAEENFNQLLLPKTNLILQGQRSLHLNQYPLSSVVVGLLVKTTSSSYEFWGRMHSIIFHLLGILFLWKLLKKRESVEMAFLASAFYLLSGLSIIYSQMFMSEYIAQFSFLGALYFAYAESKPKQRFLILTGILFSIAILNRIHYVVFALTFLPAIWNGRLTANIKQNLSFGFCALFLPVLWYGYTYFAALQSDHMHTNLFMQLAVKGEAKSWGLYFQAMLASCKTIIFYMLNPLLSIGFVIGFFSQFKKLRESAWIYIGLFSTFFLIILFPQKIIDQNFYLLPMHVFIILFSAYGILWISSRLKERASGFVVGGLIILTTLYGFRVSLHPIYTLSSQEQQDLAFIKEARSHIPENSKVAMIGISHPVAAYYLNRPFFSISPKAVGQGLEKYRQSSKFHGLTQEQITAETIARASLLSWLVFCEQQGNEYLILFPEVSLDQQSDFLAHVNTFYTSVFANKMNYRLYRRG